MSSFHDALDSALRTLACPRCGASALRRHDCRPRGVWDGSDDPPSIPVIRVRCPSCRATHTVLPDFLTPYRRYPTPLREAVLIGTETAPPCDERTVRRWVRVFQAVIMSVAIRLKANLLAKLASQRQHASNLPPCPHPHSYAELRWLRESYRQHGHAPPASGLFGWANIICSSGPAPIWI